MSYIGHPPFLDQLTITDGTSSVICTPTGGIITESDPNNYTQIVQNNLTMVASGSTAVQITNTSASFSSGAVTIDLSGNITSSGTIQANGGFYGDGSHLTGIAATALSAPAVIGTPGIPDSGAILQIYNTSGSLTKALVCQNQGYISGPVFEVQQGNSSSIFTVNGDGNVSANGNLTASYFYGDGSNLTNVANGNLLTYAVPSGSPIAGINTANNSSDTNATWVQINVQGYTYYIPVWSGVP
jgi:hypothetical protein